MKLDGAKPPLKYAPTGQQNTEKINSGAVFTPIFSPVPNRKGRKYNVAPEP
jgi:hypothetical protein